MKRSWFGLGLLVLLLAGGLVVTQYMARCHASTAQTLEAAETQAAEGSWEQAVALANQAKEDWDRSWHISATFADHEPMEEIDSQFAQLAVYAAAGEKLSFCALCAQLSSLLEAMGDAHVLNWWNFL